MSDTKGARGQKTFVQQVLRSDFDRVGDFHEKFGLDNVTWRGPGPRITPRELMEFRLKFLLEELTEFAEAVGYTLEHRNSGYGMQPTFVPDSTRPVDFTVDHAKAFDALLDLAYVTFGSAQVMGYPWEPGFVEVQRANMTKERATKAEQSRRGSTFDVIKPEGWTPPDLEKILRDHGFEV